MSKKMLINASHPEENRVAIVVDGILSELDIEIAGQEQTKGNIYKAVVVRVESGLQAAFVDYGAEKLGFLQIGEIHPNLYPPKDENGNNRPRINDILHRGQEILVQIVKEERGNKGAALTTNLSLPGRYMVLMPDSGTKGVSRKIQDDAERKKLKRTMAELNLPERMGYIVRTAGIGKEKEELKRDFDYLVRLFEGIVARKDQIKAPAQLYQESNLVIRSIRDYFSTEMDEVLIDDDKVFKDTKDFFALVMPELTHLVKQHRERRPIFSRYQIEEQIEILSKNQIPLPSGGSIVIDQTEALVAIDVNSGKMSSESGIEATAAKTNLEAAAEVGRQLRLRDLGGLIVIDFIDMRDRKHVREVELELRKALRDDKAKVSVGRISQFGLMEMSRQRLKPTLSVGSYLECPHCQGKGRVKSAENQAVSLLRQIHAAASKGHVGHIEAWVPLDVANDLLNRKRQSLVELEQRLNLRITIFGRAGMKPGDLDFELHKREKQDDNSREIAPVTHANQIESALAAQQEEREDEVEQEQQETSVVDEIEAAGDEISVEGTEEKKKSRRRRRRRKKSDRRTEADGEQAAEADSDELPEETETENVPGANEPEAKTPQQEPVKEPIAQAEAEKTESAPVKTAAEKPKRRSRRSPKKAKTEAQPVEVPAADSATAVEQPKQSPREPAEVAEQVPAKMPATATTSAEKPPKPPSEKPVKTAEERPTKTPAGETAAAKEKPKRRPRRVTKKGEEAAPETPAAEPAAVKEAPKRRTRRAPKKIEEAPKETPTAEAAAVKEAPKRRARSTPKKTEEAPAKAPAAEPASANEEKPKKRRGRPRQTPSATAESAE